MGMHLNPVEQVKGEKENMTEDSLIGLLKECLSVEIHAYKIYTHMAGAGKSGELARFWRKMADDERQHIRFWNHIVKQAEKRLLPNFIDNAGRIKAELVEIGRKIDIAWKLYQQQPSVSKALLLGYRLEFFLLHEVFESIFYFMENSRDACSPSDAYESHIDGFVDVLVKYGKASPVIELLGETLKNLWRKNRYLARQISQDELTGIFNRRGFFNAAKPLLYLSQRTQKEIGVMMLDIDDFKKLNDTHGHPAGDEVLKITARSIRNSVRASDIVGRYGGEEFIIFFSSISKRSVFQISEKIRKNIISDTQDAIPITVSIGVSTGELGDHIEKSMAALIKSADDALYGAKNLGKNRVMIAEPGMVSLDHRGHGGIN
jgi:diguanylate cyclase (GGDEF)-like protein